MQKIMMNNTIKVENLVIKAQAQMQQKFWTIVLAIDCLMQIKMLRTQSY